MKKLILILILITVLFGQGWNRYSVWNTWLTKSIPTPIAEWKWNYGITTVDTGTTVVNSLVSNWLSTNGQYDAQEATVVYRPVYDVTNGEIVFDGIDDNLEVTTLDFSNIKELTVGFWLNTNSVNATVFIEYSYNFNYNNAFMIAINDIATGKISVGDHDPTIGYNSVYTSKTYNDGKWHFVTCVLNRSNNVHKIYVDGVEDWIQHATLNKNLTNNWGTYNFFIGSRSGNVFSMDGSCAKISIYNRCLTASQVKRLYNKGRPQ